MTRLPLMGALAWLMVLCALMAVLIAAKGLAGRGELQSLTVSQAADCPTGYFYEGAAAIDSQLRVCAPAAERTAAMRAHLDRWRTVGNVAGVVALLALALVLPFVSPRGWFLVGVGWLAAGLLFVVVQGVVAPIRILAAPRNAPAEYLGAGVGAEAAVGALVGLVVVLSGLGRGVLTSLGRGRPVGTGKTPGTGMVGK